ncbi:MAG: hypothetical protein GEU90_14780 [Gemmatimonas sp.]|nr:hypothetical protein [Gemmatimonas sp.]
MSPRDLATVLLLLLAAFFFVAGVLGIVRFPDTLTRLHAVTKADNVGLGLVVFALLFQADSFLAGAKLVLIWILVLIASATSCYLIAGASLLDGDEESG